MNLTYIFGIPVIYFLVFASIHIAYHLIKVWVAGTKSEHSPSKSEKVVHYIKTTLAILLFSGVVSVFITDGDENKYKSIWGAIFIILAVIAIPAIEAGFKMSKGDLPKSDEYQM